MYNEKVKFTTPNASVRVMQSKLPTKKGIICQMHFHAELEILYVTRGTMCCHTEDNSYTASKGEIIFINSRVPHYTEIVTENTQYIMVQFAGPSHISGPVRYLARYLIKTDIPCYVFKQSNKNTTYLIEKMTWLLRESENKLRASEYYIISITYEIFAFLHRYGYLSDESTLPDKKSISTIMPIIEYIDEHYTDNISLCDISDKLNLNRNYVCRLFKNATGGTVMNYLNFVRICKSEPLLKSGMRVSEVSDMTGFSSQSYFNKVFKKYNFCAPSEYKKLSSITQNHV